MSDPIEQWLCSPAYDRASSSASDSQREFDFAARYDSAGEERAKVESEYDAYIQSLVEPQIWSSDKAPYRRRIFRELDFERGGYTALMRHAAARRSAFVLTLLRCGADPRPRSPTNRTALHYALLSKSRLATTPPDNLLIASSSLLDYEAVYELARCRGGPDLGDAEIFEIYANARYSMPPDEWSKFKIIKGLSWVYSSEEVENMKRRA